MLVKVFLCFLMISSFFSAIGQDEQTDSLFRELEQTVADSTKARLYNQLAKQYWFSAPSTALSYAHKALKCSQRANYVPTELQSYRNLGAIYWVKGEYPHALDYLYRMLKLAESTNNQIAKAQAFNNLAVIYKAQNKDSLAIDFYEKSLTIHEVRKDKENMAVVSGNLGSAYLNAKKFEESLQYNFKALKLATEIGRKRTIGNAYHNIGEVYIQKGWNQRAMDYFAKALLVFQEMGEPWSIAHAENGMATSYLQQGKLDSALSLATKAYEQALSVGAKELIKESCENLTKVYEQQENFQQAFHFQKLYHLYTDSLINEDKNKAIHQLELQQKDNEYALLRKEAKLHVLENGQKSIVIFSITGVLLVSFGLIGLLLKSRREAKKVNVLLKIKNTKIHGINQQLGAQKQEIEQQNHILTKQGIAIAEQRDFIEGKNEQITKSITAAQTIQQAMLPYEQHIQKCLKNHFIIYRPKDIVSGDFYWVNRIDNKVVIAAIDCTGHGVPGALMSMIGNTLLDNIIAIHRNSNPADILILLNDKVTKLLKQQQNNDFHGMDAAIATIDYVNDDEAEIVFAGAKRPLQYVQPNQMEIGVLAANNKAIGGRQYHTKIFKNQTIRVAKGSMLYLSSDGYEDQHNLQGRKIGRHRLGKLLCHCATLPIQEQKKLLENKLDHYMKGVNQRDDILLIGVEV